MKSLDLWTKNVASIKVNGSDLPAPWSYHHQNKCDIWNDEPTPGPTNPDPGDAQPWSIHHQNKCNIWNDGK